jgi:hypothetical protein
METPDLFPDSLSQCLFCGSQYATDYCLRCGPPVSPDPTPGELLLEAQLLYGEEDFEGDDAYAREVCINRWGPL